MACTMPDPPVPVPIPAWKRIGLKLKHAKDTAEQNTPGHARPSPKEPRPAGVDSDRPRKRKRASPSETQETQETEGTRTEATRGEPHAPTARTSPDAKPPQDTDARARAHSTAHPPRKSVSFTTSTKQLDGSPGSATPATRVDASAHAKRPLPAKQSAPNQSPPADPPKYLLYLTHFHSDRASWKFSKKLQSDLLKNSLDTDRVPAAYAPALTAYLAGLQGPAARQRLVDSASRALAEIAGEAGEADDGDGDPAPPALTSREQQRQACAAALRRHKEMRKAARRADGDAGPTAAQLRDAARDAERARRADGVLEALSSAGSPGS